MEPNTGDDQPEENKVGDIEEGGLLEPLLPSDVENGQPPVLDDDEEADALPDSTRDEAKPASFTDLFFFADKVSGRGCRIIRAALVSCITFNALWWSHLH